MRRQAVDISPLRRVNQAIWLLTTGAREAAFRNVKTIAECLADELMNAAKGSSNSYAIKKKVSMWFGRWGAVVRDGCALWSSHCRQPYAGLFTVQLDVALLLCTTN